MQKSLTRVTVAVLLAALPALASCDLALSQQQGGPNINGSPPEPSAPLPVDEPVNDNEAGFMENLLG